MGVNIFINIDEWDAFTNGGMKDILHDYERFPRVDRPAEPGDDPEDYDRDFRPTDFARWRRSIVALGKNVEMWLRGLNALEDDPNLWMSYSA